MNQSDTNYINPLSLNATINRIKLYVDNEEKIISNIKNSLYYLSLSYSSDLSNTINEKVKNIYNNLDIMLNNRKGYIEYLEHLMINYKNIDYETAIKFKNLNH